jgi:phage repressor protein C with HTH and peptisase S24 domain
MTIQADEGGTPDEDSMTELHEDDSEIVVEVKGDSMFYFINPKMC